MRVFVGIGVVPTIFFVILFTAEIRKALNDYFYDYPPNDELAICR